MLSPGEFGSLIAAETEKWAKLIRSAGTKAGLEPAGRASANSGPAGNPTRDAAAFSVGTPRPPSRA